MRSLTASCCAVLLSLIAARSVTAQVFLFEDFDDGDYDPGVLLYGDAFQNTI
jgi:hypothetical protein